MINFLHTYIPDSVLLQIGFLTIHWYGIFIVLGILAALFTAKQLGKKEGISADDIYSLSFYVIISGLVGARIYSVLLDLEYYFQHPTQIIAVWQGGLAIHGAIIGGVVAGAIYCVRKKLSLWKYADVVAPGIALGQAIGRWGNFFNQEIFGTPTNVPWGIPIEVQNRPLEYINATHFHPTFLYESILNLLNFVILILLFRWKKIKPGAVFAIYLLNYALIRIVMEQLRTDPAPILFSIRLPIVASFGLIIAVFVFLFITQLRHKEEK